MRDLVKILIAAALFAGLIAVVAPQFDESQSDAPASVRTTSEAPATEPTTTRRTTTPKPTTTKKTTRTTKAPKRTTTKPPSGHEVVRVLAGDLVEIRKQSGGARTTVRLLGIDAPDTLGRVECYGRQATSWARKVLLDERVVVRTDAKQGKRDKHRRLLAYLKLPNGKDYSTQAARHGYAKSYVYSKPVSRAAQIKAAERAARKAERGLWGAPCRGKAEPAAKTKPKKSAPFRLPSGGVPRYLNCVDAWAAGVAPLRRSESGYSPHLDRDNDGVACE